MKFHDSVEPYKAYIEQDRDNITFYWMGAGQREITNRKCTG
jgi:hypothetical protein